MTAGGIRSRPPVQPWPTAPHEPNPPFRTNPPALRHATCRTYLHFTHMATASGAAASLEDETGSNGPASRHRRR